MPSGVLILLPFVSRRDDFALLLLIDQFDHEQDYEQEHESSFGCGCRGVGQRACPRAAVVRDRAAGFEENLKRNFSLSTCVGLFQRHPL